MTVKVYFDNLEDAANMNETIGGQLNSEENSIDLEEVCPHEVEQQLRNEVSSTNYSVAVISDP